MNNKFPYENRFPLVGKNYYTRLHDEPHSIEEKHGAYIPNPHPPPEFQSHPYVAALRMKEDVLNNRKMLNELTTKKNPIHKSAHKILTEIPRLNYDVENNIKKMLGWGIKKRKRVKKRK